MTDPTGQGPDWLDSGAPRNRRRALGAVVGVCLVLAAAVATVGLVRGRDPGWPSRCGVDGHSDWCAAPSRRMTDRSLLAVVGDYCPGLSAGGPEEVEPQPLDRVDLAGGGALARTSGTSTAGTEDAVLGRSSSFSWVTRWVGGPDDGRVELRCPGSTRSLPALRLERDQFLSTAEAVGGAGRRIDFAAVARSSVPTLSPTRNVSFGFFGCDTDAVDLDRLAPGSPFTCTIQVYSAQGQGAYRVALRVTDAPPYFRIDR